MKNYIKIFKFIIVIIFIIILYELLKNTVYRNYLTQQYYNHGKTISKNLNKKLLVIGDPCSGNVFSSFYNIINFNYDHGDITIDLNGCNKCTKIDINNIKSLEKFGSNEYIIIESATLSFSNNIYETLKQLKRISGGYFMSSGGTDNLYWRLIGHKLYSNNMINHCLINKKSDSCYKNKLNYIIYPFNYNHDKIYKVYNLNTNKYEYYDFLSL